MFKMHWSKLELNVSFLGSRIECLKLNDSFLESRIECLRLNDSILDPRIEVWNRGSETGSGGRF